MHSSMRVSNSRVRGNALGFSSRWKAQGAIDTIMMSFIFQLADRAIR